MCMKREKEGGDGVGETGEGGKRAETDGWMSAGFLCRK